eukprot:c5447_g1_i1 orf=2-1210(-)
MHTLTSQKRLHDHHKSSPSSQISQLIPAAGLLDGLQISSTDQEINSDKPVEKPHRKVIGSLSQALRAINQHTNDHQNQRTQNQITISLTDQHNYHASLQITDHQLVDNNLVCTIKERASLAAASVCDQTNGSSTAQNDDDHTAGTICLAAMVDDFMQEGTSYMGSTEPFSCIATDDLHHHRRRDLQDQLHAHNCDHLIKIMQGMVGCYHMDNMEKKVMQEVNRAMGSYHQQYTSHESACCCHNDSLLLWVMRRLRSCGYNAAVCISRWEHIGILPAGSYKYIDVLYTKDRMIVDTNFKTQFEIARASKQYNELLKMVPLTFVGRQERLQAILKTMSEGAKLSLKLMGMHVPPWRKYSYMQARWFSSYKRTLKEDSLPRHVCNFHGDLQYDENCTLGSITYNTP